MTDPRKQPGYKQTRIETRIELLLGAILDRLTPPDVRAIEWKAIDEPRVWPVVEAKPVIKRRKKDAQ